MSELEDSDTEQGGLVLVSEHRFIRDPRGAIWTQTQCDYGFLKTYAQAGGQVTVVARVGDVVDVPPGYQRADGQGVAFDGLASYVGPVGFATTLPRIIRMMNRSVKKARLVILRGQGVLSAVMWVLARLRHVPFAAEVVGDNGAVFRDGKVGGRAAVFYGAILERFQEHACWEAVAVSYVTASTLQRKLPNRGSRQFVVPDVVLDADCFADGPRTYRQGDVLKLVMVGSLAQPYKGVDIALRAIELAQLNRSIELVVVGDGRLKAEYEHLAADLSIGSQVHFVGSVASGEAVRAHLGAADLFIMPSRTEGLPRALIEAMAMALPAVAARVGGIPELLDDAHMFPREGTAELAEIFATITPEEMAIMSSDNLRRAKAFSLEEISGRHEEFLQQLNSVTKTSRRQSRTKDRGESPHVA